MGARPPLETLTFELFCSDALREHLGFEKVAVLGYSCGGFVVLHCAGRYPECRSHLTLSRTAPTSDCGEEVEATARRKGATLERLEAL